MKLGFTGTRVGMSLEQQEACVAFLAEHMPSTVHHGDAIGADAEIHAISVEHDLSIVVHPPLKPAFRAFCKGNETRSEQPYMVRNRAIVDETDLLLATPAGEREAFPKSGTWRTIEYARRLGRPVTIIYPDGVRKDIGAKGVTAIAGVGRKEARSISRAEAAKIGEAALREKFSTCGVKHVCLWDEITWAKPVFYNFRTDFENLWFVYAPSTPNVIRSSTIAVIERHTGEVVHLGSAGDEG